MDLFFIDNISSKKFLSAKVLFVCLSVLKKTGEVEHKHFYDILNYLEKGDTLVLNDTKVLPARIIGKSEIAGKNIVCTETFLRIGPFDSVQECENVKSYIETKFFRCLVGARKNKNMTQNTYSFVPMQDFSKPWTDEELYKKYNLTKEEIEFIEKMIKPM